MSTVSMIDVKPFGAIAEYVIKPLLDDMRETMIMMEEHDLPARDLIRMAWRLFIVDKLLTLVQTIIVTGAICWTLYYCLLNSQTIIK